MSLRRRTLVWSCGVVLVFAGCLFPAIEPYGSRYGFDADLPRESAAGDVSVVPDAGADADADARVAQNVYCGAHPDAALCVDFSESDPLSADYWTYRNDITSDSGAIFLVGDASPEPPAAVFAQRSDAGTCNYQRLLRRFANDPKRIYARAKVFVPLGTTGSVLRFQGDGPTGQCTPYVSVNNSSSVDLTVRDDTSGNSVVDTPLVVAAAQGVWSEVTLDVDYTGTKMVTATWDGVTKSVPLPAVCKPQSVVSLGIGVHCTSVPKTLLYDEIVAYVDR